MLLFDIGNSRTKYTRVTDVGLSDTMTINNQEFTINSILNDIKSASQLIVASVSDDRILNLLTDACKQYNTTLKEIKSESQNGDVLSGYDKPETLGVDRWLALIGAEQLYPKRNLLIIDSGTATTVDLIDKEARHIGGWIMPGIETIFSSVIKSTSNVKASHISKPSLLFGRNTNTNVNSACWAMTVGAINEAIYQAQQMLGELDNVILTGGNAENIKQLIKINCIVEEQLIFYGMKTYKNK